MINAYEFGWNAAMLEKTREFAFERGGEEAAHGWDSYCNKFLDKTDKGIKHKPAKQSTEVTDQVWYMTGRSRHRVQMYLTTSVLILQIEELQTVPEDFDGFQPQRWRDATVEDLTVQNTIPKVIDV